MPTSEELLAEPRDRMARDQQDRHSDTAIDIGKYDLVR